MPPRHWRLLFVKILQPQIKVFGLRGGTVARLTFEGLDRWAVEPAAYEFDSARGNLPGPDIVRIDRLIALS